MNSRKRKFHETTPFAVSPPTKKRRLLQPSTDSHQEPILSPSLSVELLTNSNSLHSTSSGSTDGIEVIEVIKPIQILEHRVQNDWIHFKVVQPGDAPQDFQWLKHEQLQHSNVCSQYMKSHDLTLDDVSKPQYFPQMIMDHHFNEEKNRIEFLIQWKDYSHEDPTWEPHENLRDNKIYIEYCKKTGITPLVSDFNDYDDEEEEEEEHPSDLEEEDAKDEGDELVSSSDIDDITHIENAYHAAHKQQKTFTTHDIEAIIANIDTKTQHIFNPPATMPPSDNHNHNDDAKKETEIDHDRLATKLADIRKYFETLKQELLCKQFAQNGFMKENTKPCDNTNSMKTPSNRTHKTKRRTLFDYAFTPTPSAMKTRRKITNDTNTKTPLQSTTVSQPKGHQTPLKSGIKPLKQSHLIDISEYKAREDAKEEEIPIEYYKSNNTCYGCKRKWPLYGVEYFKAFPMCKQCPTHIRLGYNRKFKEDWFCPYCVHSAHTNGLSLGLEDTALALPSTANLIYLYVKPNGSNYWKTYIPLRVLDVERQRVLVRLKKKGQQRDIILSDIPKHHILWAYHDKSERIMKNSSGIHKVMEVRYRHDTVVIKETKQKKQTVTVPRSQVIHCALYLQAIIMDTQRQHKRRRITWDRKRIFRHSIRIKTERREKDRAKYQLGANTKIIESAPQNSRHFNHDGEDGGNDEEMKEIPQYPDTTPQLLDVFGLSCVPDNFVQPPHRRLILEDITQYALVLIVGPSGSGKSTLLRDLQSQNPSQVTFKSPSCLSWDNSKCVISQFGDIPVSEAMSNMSSIGLNNVRTWLKPFNILSQGEAYRCAFARLLQLSRDEPDKVIIMDEFTSVLDRTNARAMAVSTSKCIRRNNKRNGGRGTFVLASANADIIRYMQPDVLFLLGGDEEMKCIKNPNDLNDIKSLFDVKAICDLPPFKRRKDEGSEAGDHDECKCIYPLTMFNDLVPFTAPISVTNEVRQLSCKVQMDAHAKQTANILDVEDFEGVCMTHIPCLQKKHLNGEFNIGVMCGPSGCGKTSSGERLFGRPQAVKWDESRNIASHFQSCGDLQELFAAVHLPLNLAFSRFEYLSEGEQHRVNIARMLSFNHHIIIDEFTSYLDRETAKQVAKGVSDYIYKYDKKNIVFLCCKYDIISASNGMHPSWIFDVPNKKMTHYRRPRIAAANTNRNDAMGGATPATLLYATHSFFDISNLWNPPKIRLVLKPATKYDFSPTFSKYHYMDASISTSAKCWSVWAYFSYLATNDGVSGGKSDKEEASDDDDDNSNECDEGFYEENELELCGFISVMNHYGTGNVGVMSGAKKKIDYREHRTVILPAFQGLGFGSRISDCVGEYLSLHGLRLHSKTAHPRYGGYRNKQPSLWIPTKQNGKRLSRTEWKKDVDRILFGGQQKAVGHEKQYFIHVYTLHSDQERSDAMNEKLKSRVIVKKQYKKLS